MNSQRDLLFEWSYVYDLTHNPVNIVRKSHVTRWDAGYDVWSCPIVAHVTTCFHVGCWTCACGLSHFGVVERQSMDFLIISGSVAWLPMQEGCFRMVYITTNTDVGKSKVQAIRQLKTSMLASTVGVPCCGLLIMIEVAKLPAYRTLSYIQIQCSGQISVCNSVMHFWSLGRSLLLDLVFQLQGLFF